MIWEFGEPHRVQEARSRAGTATARAIARRAGIDSAAVIPGAELEKLDDAALAACVGKTSVLARIMPDQKLRIVRALKANGESSQ